MSSSRRSYRKIVVELDGAGSSPHKVSFETSAGHVVHLTSNGGIAAGGSHGTQWDSSYSADGSFAALTKDQRGTVIIGSSGQIRVPVQVRPAKSASDMAGLGPTKTHQGITLTVIATRNGRTGELTVVPQYQGSFHIWNAAPSVGTGLNNGIEITDHRGTRFRVKQVFQLQPNNQFTFTPAPGVTDYQVTIPYVNAEYFGDAHVTLPVPDKGSETVDRNVTLSGFPFEITKVMRVSGKSMGDKPALRVYVDLHAALDKPKSLISFSFNRSGEWVMSNTTGAMRWFEVPVTSSQSSLSLKLSNAQVYIHGPWTFDVHVPSATDTVAVNSTS